MNATTGPWKFAGADRYELGEGARAVGDGFVFVDLLAGRLYATSGSPNELPAVHADLDVPLGAVAPTTDGGWLAAAGTGFAVIRADGGVSWLATPLTSTATAMRTNDGVADPQGRFWAGAMPYDGPPGAGMLFRLDPHDQPVVVADGLTVPNGPAFDADGAVMYLADSPLGIIYRYEVDVASGDIRRRDVFATVATGSPDGMTVDATGSLWVAIWGGSCLHRYAPDGTLLEAIPVPAAQPTSIALTTSAPYRVLVTTATYELSHRADADGRVLVAASTIGGIATNTAKL